ncbi:MAG: 6-carboxytetrahydropterin synthase [Bacteroidota bacterium]|nr:6-carboxytetrahydropterin synthase [Bacteroidota bacterium]MDP4229897.1 6-carboxytetrahydropterin synthase [Bacteroidota bacterium]MDP4237436.1 6-carboxytetrahydropterin synthase [Bacteroidota bacterium]
MLTKISKSFHWEMAHRLPFHTGGCRNIHGHSYALTVEITGEPDANGMVLDYFDLVTIVEPFIKEIDHSFLCDRSDAVVKDFLLANGFKTVFVDFPTTAENIATWFFERLSTNFMQYKNIRELRISVSETERTTAEVSGEIRIAPFDKRVFEHQAHMLE